MNKLVKRLLPVICLVIQLAAMLLFAYSFFNAEDVLFGARDVKSADDGVNDNNNPVAKRSKAYSIIQSDDNYRTIADRCEPRLTESRTKPLFPKMVLMVVDALRHDFIPSIDKTKLMKTEANSDDRVANCADCRMPFTETLLKTNGIGLVSLSATPTVTMPRIKAMISGTLPSFMDFIMNLSAYKFNGENLIENLNKTKKRINFFGDETWIDLLPANLFYRYNGTSSFFATDYTEVDTNVTYCVDQELKRLNDWDVMIMHYLGVDHIGHSHGGYHSRLMPKKLLEMDSVVKNIYTNVTAPDVSEPYLIVITGDHGMTDIGNHGGNTPQETDTALLFLSTKKTKTSSEYNGFGKRALRVRQVDIASTLSVLLGVPVPNKSMGKVMLDVLNAMNMKKDNQLCHMFANALHISDLIVDLSPSDRQLIQKAFKFHTKITDENNNNKFNSGFHYKSTADLYNKFIDSLQMQLLTKFTEKSFFSLLTLSIIFAILSIFGFIFIEFCNRNSLIFTKIKDIQTMFAIIIVALNCLLLLSTSFIENEHYFWYYMTSSFVAIYLAITVRNHYRYTHQTVGSLVDPFVSLRDNSLIQVLAIVLILILLKMTHEWNILYDYDIGEWLNKTENKRILTVLVIVSLIAISYLMFTKRFFKQQCLLISGLVWVYLYRSGVGSVSSVRIPYFNVETPIRAKIVFFHVYLIIIESFLKRVSKLFDFNFNIPFLDFLKVDFSSSDVKPVTNITLRTICTVWVLLSALFFKVHNIPLLTINIGLEKLVNYALKGRDDSYRLSLLVTYLCFAQSAFYSAGNSNTLSTIDVSPAFIGLDSYQPFFATIFMIISVYSLYVYWILMFFIRFCDSRPKPVYKTSGQQLRSIINILLMARFATVLFDMSVTIALQNHLFIWSVLCPKFLYEALLTLVTELILLFVIFNNLIVVSATFGGRDTTG
ncbi:uncharacterized protein LOC128955597 [Oppia nitens]|uniref:uncharacterized protein LOC128955597 n=1 Tax=Oppia nitens TaxID=1686743 RepID=UPI0023DB59E8|nr:uncharacterized protein LOC128955597 [Oppia nitens]